jgi:hypothetical protein
MFKATRKSRKQIVGNQVVPLAPGQFISGRNAASQELGISASKFVRTMEKMKMLEFVDTKPNNKFTVFSIINWARYQDEQTTGEQQAEQQADNKRTTSGQQSDTNKNVKNDKNGKKKNKDNFPHGENRAVGDEVEFYLTKKKRKLTGKRLDTFKQFWEAFGYFHGKAEAADAWLDIPTLTTALVDTILVAARREAMVRPSLIANGKTPKWAQGWITARRWEDEQDDVRELTPEEQTARDIAEAKRLRAQGGCQ